MPFRTLMLFNKTFLIDPLFGTFVPLGHIADLFRVRLAEN